MILHLSKPRQPTDFSFDVLNQPRYQLVRPLVLWALKFVIVVGWGAEMSIQGDESAECTMAEITFVRGSVECSLAGRVMRDAVSCRTRRPS